MSRVYTYTASEDCDIIVHHPQSYVHVLGKISTISYIVDDESDAVTGSLVFETLSGHPDGFVLRIDAQTDRNVVIRMTDTTFSDRIELGKTVQFAASSHTEVGTSK